MADETLSLREAAGRVGRSAGTLRRYIKTGRLAAEKHQGKFGVEYRIRVRDLEHLRVGSTQLQAPLPAVSPAQKEWVGLLDRFIPVSVYNDLTEKHERLLVEFGMLRGRVGELPGQVAAELGPGRRDREGDMERLKARAEEDKELLRRHLRETEQEVRDREAEIILLREKVNRLEQRFLEINADGPLEADLEIAGQSLGFEAAPEPQRVRRAVGRLRQLLEVCHRETEASRSS